MASQLEIDVLVVLGKPDERLRQSKLLRTRAEFDATRRDRIAELMLIEERGLSTHDPGHGNKRQQRRGQQAGAGSQRFTTGSHR
jgi:hypothetical protein